jgi:hypothetical protein
LVAIFLPAASRFFASAIAVPYWGIHRYYLDVASPGWEFVYLVVYGREILRITSAIEKRIGNRLVLSPCSSILMRLHGIMTSLFNAETMTAFENSRMAYDICMDILGEAFSPGSRDSMDRFAIRAYVERLPIWPITLNISWEQSKNQPFKWPRAACKSETQLRY